MTRREKQIRWAKILDIQLGRFLSVILPSLSFAFPRRSRPTRIRKILFVKFWGMGSIILTEPALRWLAKQYPEARFEYLTLDENRELLGMFPQVSQTHSLRSDGLGGLVRDSWRLLRKLRRERFDLVFDAEFFVNFSALFARLAGGQWVTGFDAGQGAKRYLQDHSQSMPEHMHAVQAFLLLAQSGSQPPGLSSPRLTLQARTTKWRGTSPYIVVNINSGPLALERRWPRDRFGKLIEALLSRSDFQLMLIGSKAESDFVKELAEGLPESSRIFNLAGRSTLPELASLIENAALLISNDSGPLHLAAALDVPVVGFFGPETPARYGPLAAQKLVFYQNLECSPCMKLENWKTITCHNDRSCMKSIEVDHVIAEIFAFVDHSIPGRPSQPRRLVSLCT